MIPQEKFRSLKNIRKALAEGYKICTIPIDEETSQNIKYYIMDVILDLMHVCKENHVDFKECSEHAFMHFKAENEKGDNDEKYLSDLPS